MNEFINLCIRAYLTLKGPRTKNIICFKDQAEFLEIDFRYNYQQSS
jgi:hypothetical protein